MSHVAPRRSVVECMPHYSSRKFHCPRKYHHIQNRLNLPQHFSHCSEVVICFLFASNGGFIARLLLLQLRDLFLILNGSAAGFSDVARNNSSDPPLFNAMRIHRLSSFSACCAKHPLHLQPAGCVLPTADFEAPTRPLTWAAPGPVHYPWPSVPTVNGARSFNKS
jgi:hypothetical protein